MKVEPSAARKRKGGVSIGQNGRVEMTEHGFQCFRPEFGALLVKGGGRRGVCLQTKEIKQLYPGAGRTAGNQERITGRCISGKAGSYTHC